MAETRKLEIDEGLFALQHIPSKCCGVDRLSIPVTVAKKTSDRSVSRFPLVQRARNQEDAGS